MLKYSPHQKRSLVDALLNCPIFQTSQGRDQIVSDLPPAIQFGILRRADSRSDTTNIIDRCLNYPDGLSKLLEQIAFYEEDSIPFREVLRQASLLELVTHPTSEQPDSAQLLSSPEFSSMVAAILSPAGHPKGAGFLAAQGLILSCAHVVEQAGAAPGENVQIRFHNQTSSQTARVLAEAWRAPDEEDIAVIRLEKESPAGIPPLPLGVFRGTSEQPFHTFGFPIQGALSGGGQIMGWAEIRGKRLLQLRSKEVTQGFSGAPVWSTYQGCVVGMITSITQPDPNERLKETAFAIPAEVLRVPPLYIQRK